MSVPPKRVRSDTSDRPYKTGEVRRIKEFQSDRLSFGRQKGAARLEVEFAEREVRRNAKSMQEIYMYIYARYEEWRLRP